MGRVRTRETEVFAPCLSLGDGCILPGALPLGAFLLVSGGLQTVSLHPLPPAHHGLGARDKLETCPAPKDSRDAWCSGEMAHRGWAQHWGCGDLSQGGGP